MPFDRRLSTLEFTALGIVLKRGPCTAYAVMTEFSGSQTTAYRSGAGSIYPLIQRLEKNGLLSVSNEGGEKRYLITDAGIEALRSWFRISLDEEAFSCSLDVLRSRTYFLKVLNAEQREEFFAASLKGLSNLLKVCRRQVSQYRKAGDLYSALAMEGAVMETQARIRWVKKYQTEIAKVKST